MDTLQNVSVADADIEEKPENIPVPPPRLPSCVVIGTQLICLVNFPHLGCVQVGHIWLLNLHNLSLYFSLYKSWSNYRRNICREKVYVSLVMPFCEEEFSFLRANQLSRLFEFLFCTSRHFFAVEPDCCTRIGLLRKEMIKKSHR